MTTQSDPIADAVEAATRRVAPLWPLKTFVAVNPYLGFTSQSFDATMADMARFAGARMTMERAEYLAAVSAGRITRADLRAALAEVPAAADPEALLSAAAQAAPTPAPLATRADLAGGDWSAQVGERLSQFAAAWFDAGQARMAAPGQAQGFYAAWRVEMSVDRTAELLGLAGARARAAGLPETAEALFAQAVTELGLEDPQISPYFTRLLYTLPGWAGFARYRLWQAELQGGTDRTLTDLLAARLGWELLLQREVDAAAWARAKQSYAETPDVTETQIDRALQGAYEIAWQRQMQTVFATDLPPGMPVSRPALQAAFCIDVRSEVFRRALETAHPGTETIGFAGFFGAAIDFTPLGAAEAGARCPVLLRPGLEIAETAPDAPTLAATRRARLSFSTALSGFKEAAVASFGYVETLGLGYAGRLAGASLGRWTGPGKPAEAGLSAAEAESLGPDLDDVPAEGRLDMAATILTAMSLTGPFARLVVLAGHGSTSANNPHAAGLDCGACGGHDGAANARLACAILNDPAVRAGLPSKGIDLPGDSWFVPALHDTTTDEVALYDTCALPESHREDIAALRDILARAGQLARAERAQLLHLEPGADTDRAVAARASDWSQVRPEWGLAGCAAFVAAPRHRTAGRDLGGRAFLHSYDWQADSAAGYGVLELIMTAPLVVASWINLQYYGSATDNRVFGAGNKVLHNVTGTLGVLEGNGGDLRSGLPWQSVHDGERLIHEPMRLNAVIEAPTEAMNEIIARHGDLRNLVDNGWVHLWQMDAEGRIAQRYLGKGVWETLLPESSDAIAA